MELFSYTIRIIGMIVNETALTTIHTNQSTDISTANETVPKLLSLPNLYLFCKTFERLRPNHSYFYNLSLCALLKIDKENNSEKA